MEANSSDWPVVFIELLQQRADAIIPKLNDSGVQTIVKIELKFHWFIGKHEQTSPRSTDVSGGKISP